MADLPLTLALERYDRHIPFFDGSVAPAGVALIWVAATEEPMPFDLPAGARLERVPPGARLDELLLDGTLQAVAHPQPPPAIQGGDPRVRRLFADAPAEERAYYQRNGYWPAMHVVAFKETILREHPWVAEAFMAAFARAREIAYRYYDDPNWSRLAWGRHYFEDELALFRRRSVARRPGGQPPLPRTLPRVRPRPGAHRPTPDTGRPVRGVDPADLSGRAAYVAFTSAMTRLS